MLCITLRPEEMPEPPIYLDEVDFGLFLEVQDSTCEWFNWVIHSSCLMTNHYHLLVDTPDGNLSNIAAFQSGGYTRKKIDEYFGLNYFRISWIVAKNKTDSMFTLRRSND